MVHLSRETLSQLMDGVEVAGSDEHLAACDVCRGELEALEELRTELRSLPELEPPAGQWSAIEARVSGGRPGRRRLGRARAIALQAAAMAAVFVLGLGLGRMFGPAGEGPEAALTAGEPSAASLAEAMAEVRRRGIEYDAALNRLETIAREAGTPVPSLAQERLAALNVLVEASRTALSVEPADPILNSYLFAALEERDNVMRQMSTAGGGTDSEVLWR